MKWFHLLNYDISVLFSVPDYGNVNVIYTSVAVTVRLNRPFEGITF